MNNKRNGRYNRNDVGYSFPSWNYGCTLGNNSQTGAYETYYKAREPNHHEVPIAQPSSSEEEPAVHTEEKEAEEAENPSLLDKPIQDILNGRNPIVFCNEQSKMRGMNMEWEQVSESGPPHMKVFKWCLKIGDMSVEASANSKKGAKNKAAEDMARKLDQLPKPKKRNHFQMMGGYPGYPPMMYGMNPMAYPPNMYGAPWLSQQPRQPKKKKPNEGSSAEAKPKPPNPSQDNPISQLYEYCKRVKSPEPIFTTICEKPLESRVTDRGFYRKKVEFTLQVEVVGKKFEGTAMTKKEAKHRAAGVAWAAIQDETKGNDG